MRLYILGFNCTGILSTLITADCRLKVGIHAVYRVYLCSFACTDELCVCSSHLYQFHQLFYQAYRKLFSSIVQASFTKIYKFQRVWPTFEKLTFYKRHRLQKNLSIEKTIIQLVCGVIKLCHSHMFFFFLLAISIVESSFLRG